MSVGGAYQMIGNVWEWTADDFLWIAALADQQTKQPEFKTIRGGAFDTYFDNQATSQFASGEDPLGRKHNIGFRCALSVCDLAPVVPHVPPEVVPQSKPEAARHEAAAAVAEKEAELQPA